MIPIIQRDYAQGRSDKGPLRKNFLASLKQALDGTLPNRQTEMKLDFVYGSVENNIMLPLDGQQRLTTLWLLHWYIALKSGKLADAQEMLSRFTYETRRSSREFCNHLCNPENFKNLDSKVNLYDYITSRTWFSLSWLNDPTITSMLRMISGTVIDLEDVDKKNLKEAVESNAMIDGLEKIFSKTTPEEFRAYWDKMISDTPPFYFYQLPLHEFGLSDDLYIKMNARGKQLTPFENFKADLIGYIRQRAKEREEGLASDKPDADQDWASLLDPRKGIPIKLDTEWTDIFWEKRSSDNTIDEIFFSFLNRVFWEEFIVSRHSTPDTEADTDEDEDNGAKTMESNESYRFLITDDILDYHDLGPYKFYKGEIPFALFKNLNIILDRLQKIKVLPDMPRNVGEKFHFIPIYLPEPKKNEPISRLTQPHRVIFHAVYKYLLEGDFDEESFRRWLRVICNITSGKSQGGDWNRYIIRTTATMLSAIDIISELDSHHVYESLKNRTSSESKKEVPSRFQEEIIKAKKILGDNGKLNIYDGHQSTRYETWEDAIISAENYSFFNGSIRFLYQDADGQVDWDDFDAKYTKAREYFRMEISDVNDNNVVTDKYASNATLLRSIISRFTDCQFWEVIWWRKHYLFDNSEMSWRYYLYNNAISKPIHDFFTEGDNIIEKNDSTDRAEHILFLLSNTNLLDYAMDKFKNSYIRTYHGHDAIYPSATGIFLDAGRRDEFLHQPDVKVINGEMIPDNSLIYGTDIDFVYGNHSYRWYRDNKIYLMDSDDTNEYITLNQSGEELYFYIESNGKDNPQLKKELEELPHRFEMEKQNLESQLINDTQAEGQSDSNM